MNPVVWLVIFIMAGRSPLSRLGIPLEQNYSFAMVALMMCVLTAFLKNVRFSEYGSTTFKLVSSIVFTSIVLFFIWGSLSAAFSPVVAGQKYIDLWLVLISFLLPIWLIRDTNELKVLLISLTLICSLLSLLGLFFMLTREIARLSVLGGGPNVFARLMFIGACSALALAYWQKKEGSITYIPCVIASAISFLALIFSGSRGGMLAVIVSAVALLLLLMFNYRSNINKTLLQILLSVAVFFLIILPFVYDRIYSIFIERLAYFFSDAAGGAAIKSRYSFSSVAFEMFNSSPLIGHGLGSFQISTGDYPHNLSLEILAELGLVGYMPILVALIAAFFALFMFPRYSGIPFGGHANANARSTSAIEAGFIFLFLTYIFLVVEVHLSGDLFDSRWLFFLLGLAIAIFRLDDSGNKQCNNPKLEQST